jgi:hypothetical protein
MLEDMKRLLLEDGYHHHALDGDQQRYGHLSGYPTTYPGRSYSSIHDEDQVEGQALELPEESDAGSGGTSEGRCFGGTSIRLHFDLLPSCSEQQLWNRQAGRCMGCHQTLQSMPQQPQRGAQSDGRPAPSGGGTAAGNLWGGSSTSAPPALGPRVCCYTGGLYCSDCHRRQTAVLPSRVLRSWDFVPRPVCCVAFDYLFAIRDQPLLCITAINPGLYTR